MKIIFCEILTDSYIYFCYKENNTYYVVMDYCQGGSLASKIRGSPPPPEFEVQLSEKRHISNYTSDIIYDPKYLPPLIMLLAAYSPCVTCVYVCHDSKTWLEKPKKPQEKTLGRTTK